MAGKGQSRAPPRAEASSGRGARSIGRAAPDAELASLQRAAGNRAIGELVGLARAICDPDRARAVRTASLLGRLAAELGLRPGEVEIRVDDRAAARARARGVPGLAEGRVVDLDPAAYDGRSPRSLELLAHEVVHVAQARLPAMAQRPADGAADPAEVEAAALARRFASGARVGRPLLGLAPGQVARFSLEDLSAAETLDHIKRQVADRVSDAIADRGPARWVANAMLRWAIGEDPDIDGEAEAEAARTAARAGRDERPEERRAGRDDRREERRAGRDDRREVRAERRARRAADPDAFRAIRRLERAERRRLRAKERDIRREMAADRVRRREERGAARINAGDVVARLVRALIGVGGELLRATPVVPLAIPVDLDGLDLELVADVGMRGVTLSGSLETRILGAPIRIGDPLSGAAGERPAAAAEPAPATVTIVLGGVEAPRSAHRRADRLLRGARIAAGVVVRGADEAAADLAITVDETDLDAAREVLASDGDLGAASVVEERGPARMPTVRERAVERRARQVTFHFPWLSTDVYATLPETRTGPLATGPGYLTPSHLSLEWLELAVPDLGLSPIIDWGENGPPRLRIDQVDLGPGHGDLFDQLRFADGPVSVTLLGGLVAVDGLDLAGGAVAAEAEGPDAPARHTLRFAASRATLALPGLTGSLADPALTHDPNEGLVVRGGATRLAAGAVEVSVDSIQIGPGLALVLRGGAATLGPLTAGFEQATFRPGVAPVIEGVTPPLAARAVEALLAGASWTSLLPGAGALESATGALRSLGGALSNLVSSTEAAAPEPAAVPTADDPLDERVFTAFDQHSWYDGSGRFLCTYAESSHELAIGWLAALKDLYAAGNAEHDRVREEAGMEKAATTRYVFTGAKEYATSTLWNFLNDEARKPAGSRTDALNDWIDGPQGQGKLTLTVKVPAAAHTLGRVMFIPGPQSCFEAVKGMMHTAGATPLKPTQMNIFREADDEVGGHVDRSDEARLGRIAAKTAEVIAYLDATLPTPVMVGVSYRTSTFNRGWADHWVVVYERGEDADGVFYSFADPANGQQYSFRRDADGILVGRIRADKFYEVQAVRRTESRAPVREDAAAKPAAPPPGRSAPDASPRPTPAATDVPDPRDLAMARMLDRPEVGPRFYGAVVALRADLQPLLDHRERALHDEGRALLGDGADHRAVERFRDAARMEGHATERVFQELLDQVAEEAAAAAAPPSGPTLTVTDAKALRRDASFERTGGTIPLGTEVVVIQTAGAFVQVVTPPGEPYAIEDREGVWTAASNLGPARGASPDSAPSAPGPAPHAPAGEVTPAPMGGSLAPELDLSGRDDRYRAAVERLRRGTVPPGTEPSAWITDELFYGDHQALRGAGGIAGVKDAAERARLGEEWTAIHLRYGIPVARHVAHAATTVPSGELVDVARTDYRASVISTESDSYATVNRRGRATPKVTLPAHREGDHEWALGRYQFMEATLFGFRDDIALLRPGYDLAADQEKDWAAFLADGDLQDRLFTPYNNRQADDLFRLVGVSSWAALLAKHPVVVVARSKAGSPSRNMFHGTPWFVRDQAARRTWENVAVLYPWVTVTRSEIRVQTTVSGVLGAMHLGGPARARDLLVDGSTASDNLGTSTLGYFIVHGGRQATAERAEPVPIASESPSAEPTMVERLWAGAYSLLEEVGWP